MSDLSDAVAAIRRGETVALADRRHGIGRLIHSAQSIEARDVAFMVRHTTGYLRVAMTDSRADELNLPLIAASRGDADELRYAVTVDASDGISTGISAADRALTIRRLAARDSRHDQFSRPGHVVPLRVPARSASRELRYTYPRAAIELMDMAGQEPLAVVAELVRSSSSIGLATCSDLWEFAAQHALALISVEEALYAGARCGSSR